MGRTLRPFISLKKDYFLFFFGILKQITGIPLPRVCFLGDGPLVAAGPGCSYSFHLASRGNESRGRGRGGGVGFAVAWGGWLAKRKDMFFFWMYLKAIPKGSD